jgi:hypothetical protein
MRAGGPDRLPALSLPVRHCLFAEGSDKHKDDYFSRAHVGYCGALWTLCLGGHFPSGKFSSFPIAEGHAVFDHLLLAGQALATVLLPTGNNLSARRSFCFEYQSSNYKVT